MKTLFDIPVPKSHRADPDTSYIAAEKLAKSGHWITLRKLVYETLRLHNGSTSAELGQFMGTDRYTTARRLPELERDGLIEKGPKRMCGVQKSLCVTWFLAGTKPE